MEGGPTEAGSGAVPPPHTASLRPRARSVQLSALLAQIQSAPHAESGLPTATPVDGCSQGPVAAPWPRVPLCLCF